MPGAALRCKREAALADARADARAQAQGKTAFFRRARAALLLVEAQFLLDAAAQAVAGIVVALFVYWLNRR